MSVSLTTGTTERTERTAARFTVMKYVNGNCGTMQTATYTMATSVRPGCETSGRVPTNMTEPTLGKTHAMHIISVFITS